jgi:DNA-binding MarR family transcriptional regulator
VTGGSAVRASHAGNLLGALALAVADRTSDSIESAAARSLTGAAALSAMVHFLDRPSIDLLRRVLGLTSSGTVRLVDRLERDGLVVRRAGDDARVTTVELTPAGRRAGRAVAAGRAEVVESVLSSLDPRERDQLDLLLGKALVGMIRGPGATRWMCRLCDTGACGREEGRCPVANATGAVRPPLRSARSS